MAARSQTDDQGDVRRAVALALGKIGPVAKAELPALEAMAGKADPFGGKEIATKAIEQIRGK